jgi:hypothetical protein
MSQIPVVFGDASRLLIDWMRYGVRKVHHVQIECGSARCRIRWGQDPHDETISPIALANRGNPEVAYRPNGVTRLFSGDSGNEALLATILEKPLNRVREK